MKRSIALWQFFGFAFTAFAGTLLHFLYDWTGQSLMAAPFSGINESTWEHMKLLFVPLFLFALFQRRLFREDRSFWYVKLAGTLLGLVSIPSLFYTLNGAFGPTPDWINISIFFVSAAMTFWWENRLFRREDLSCPHPNFAIAILCLIGLAFFIFTFFPPQIPLFADPLTGTYGITG